MTMTRLFSAIKSRFTDSATAKLASKIAGASILAVCLFAARGLSQVPANPPGSDSHPPPKWVREPVGGSQSGKFLRVADARGQGESVAALLALDASSRKSIILLVQGSNRKIIEDARRELSSLVLDGYDRLGLVLGDGAEDTAYIYSKGFKVTTFSNVGKARDRDIAFSDDIERIYKRDVLSVAGR